MFDNSDWDCSEFKRGYQAALDDIHHPDTCRQKFEVFDKENPLSHGSVYATREKDGEIFFLIYKYGKWMWGNANKFEPRA